jgi:glycine/D-amino acid oxidase-like deaminating enzyme
MGRTKYGVAPWLGPAKGGRPTYPVLAGTLDVQAAIVGGGLAGAATAYACAAGGVRVAILEAGRIGHGASGRSAGLMLQSPAQAFAGMQRAHGRRAARAIWTAWRRAALELSATIRRLNLRCGLTPADAVTWAPGGDRAVALQRELAARREGGLEATWLTARALAALGVEGAVGIRTKGDALVDPARLCQGFARAAAVRGAAVFERTGATRIHQAGRRLAIHTARGVVSCETVVVATGEPTALFDPLARHFDMRESYVVQTAPIPRQVRSATPDRHLILQDVDDPPHRLAWSSGDRIVWSGADQPRTPERLREKTLVQRTGQLMYELSLMLPAISGIQPEYGWDAPYSVARDGLPFIGPHRNYPHHLFALGLGTNPASAFLASRVLLRHLTGTTEKADDVFGFARLPR